MISPVMQVYESSLGADRRPCAPKDCVMCGGCRKLHRNGSYQRYRNSEGRELVTVQLFLCPQCGLTVSVIPSGMFPYRSMPVARFEELADDSTRLAGGGARPPPATQIEAGCIRRALERLSKCIPFLCGLLGQQMPLPEGPGIHWFWPALRKLGSTEEILIRLARDFKTSLFACYHSLATTLRKGKRSRMEANSPRRATP
jgi:hypothetical protein